MTGAPIDSWDLEVALFPHPPADEIPLDGSIAPTFIFAAAVVNMVLLIQGVVAEKATGFRGAMTTAGMFQAPYWATWYLVEAAVSLFNSLVVVALGYAFGFNLVTQTSFTLVLMLLFLAFSSVSCFGRVSRGVPSRVAEFTPFLPEGGSFCPVLWS